MTTKNSKVEGGCKWLTKLRYNTQHPCNSIAQFQPSLLAKERGQAFEQVLRSQVISEAGTTNAMNSSLFRQ